MNQLSKIFSFFALVSFSFLFSTVFALHNDLANDVVSAKYFWFYLAMGLIAVSLTIAFLFSSKFKIVFSFSDFLFGLVCLVGVLPFLMGTEVINTKFILFVLLFILYFYFRLILSLGKFHRNVLIVCIILTALAESVWGLRQLYGFIPSQHNLFLLTGSFFNPGPYAGYLAMILPLAFYFLLADYKVWKAKFNKKLLFFYVRWIISASAFVAIVLVLPAAMSRAAWIAACGSCAFVGITYWARSHNVKACFLKNRKIILSISVLLIVLLAVGAAGMYRFKKDSADGRVFIWKTTISAMLKNPLGVGLGNFAGAYGSVQAAYFKLGKATEQEKRVAGNPEYAFNEYLQIGLELGVAGLLLFLAVVVLALYKGLKFSRFETTGALISLLIFASMSYPFSVLPYLIVFVFLLADTASCSTATQSVTLSPIPSKVILVVSFIIVVLCLQNRYASYQAYKDWKMTKIMFSMNQFEEVKDDYKNLEPYLSDKVEFLFEYGQVLSKTGAYRKSNEVLQQATRISCDPMLYNVMGKNYQALSNQSVNNLKMRSEYFELAEKNFKIACDIVPNRLYPYYLLTKLYIDMTDTVKAKKMATIVLEKEAKIHSPAIEEMREELIKLLAKLKPNMTE